MSICLADDEVDVSAFVRVGAYLVAPKYIAPVGIGTNDVRDAILYARARGFDVPTPELVNDIWKAADLKVDPHPLPHDGSERMLQSKELREIYAGIVSDAVVRQVQRAPERPWHLIAGTHTDVVQLGCGFGVYGWHRLDGRPLQPPMHAKGTHYTMGLRLVKKVA